MEIKIQIPDQVYNEDPTYAEYFTKVQAMVDRMAMSHYKYGRVDDNAKLAEVDELKNALQRISMYDPANILQAPIWPSKAKEVSTGNTENLLDAANFLIIEAIFPKHPKAFFKAQTSAQSPGLTFKD